MASKKLKKAIGAALVGFGAAKALGARADAVKKAASITTDPDMGSEMANDTTLAKSMRNSMLKKSKSVKNMVPKKKPGSGSSGSSGMSYEKYGNAFGLGDMGGAKAGKMIKARGGKLVNLKPTKLY